MIKLLIVIIQKIIRGFNTCGEDMADGIKTDNWKQAFLNLGLIILLGLGCLAGATVLLYLALRYWWILLIGAFIVWGIQALFENGSTTTTGTGETDIDVELARQRGLELQPYAIGLMLRVLIAISAFTAICRPRTERDIEVRMGDDGASFYMKGSILVYQAEVEVEGEITPEVEDTIHRETQRYILKYVVDYPMLISPEAGGHAPVEILGVKNCGNRVLIDFVFTTEKSIPMINARRRARLERQKRQERLGQYTDPDYGE